MKNHIQELYHELKLLIKEFNSPIAYQ